MGEGRSKREGVCVYRELIHFVLWQKPSQQCKAIIAEFKKGID